MAGAPPDRDVRRTVDITLLILVGLILVLVGLERPVSGLAGYYGLRGAGDVTIPLLANEKGEPLPIIDRAIAFFAPHRLDAAYVFNWNMRRLKFPATLPAYRIAWRGYLMAPEGGTYGFHVDGRGEVKLRLDGTPVEVRNDAPTERALTAGLHQIEIDYLQNDGEPQPIPSRYLGPEPESFRRARSRSLLKWTLLAAALVAGLWILIGARRRSARAERLLSRIGAGSPRLALGLILLLAAILRFNDYALVPFHHETADEYQHAWEGWNLLHEGAPASWSAFAGRYPTEQTREFLWFGDPYVVVWPYFDHPPLFSALVGLASSIGTAVRGISPGGGPGYLLSSLPVMRLVPILFSLVGVFLIHRLGRAYGASERGALLGALVYATLPVIILGHRLVKAENLLVLLLMGAVLLVRRHERTGLARDAVLAGVLCGLSIWTKATGVAVIATVLILLIASRRTRGAFLAAGVTAGFLLLYLLYAWWYGWDQFIAVIQAQATSKWASLDTFLDFFWGKAVVKPFGRGWYLWLLLGGAYAALRRQRALLIPVVIYVAVLALFADYRVIYGWYRIPIIPFLCVACGLYLEEMIEEADLFRVFPFAATAVVTGLLYALSVHPVAAAYEAAANLPTPISVAQTQVAVALFGIVTLGPTLLRLVHDRVWTRRLAQACAFLMLVVFVVTSVASVHGLPEIYAATRGIR
jgi:4-amino-4-deoxy-L-arabinose transferase-like glycosyltransferase